MMDMLRNTGRESIAFLSQPHEKNEEAVSYEAHDLVGYGGGDDGGDDGSVWSGPGAGPWRG